MGAMVSHEMASARSQWEIARNTSFPGRKWGVELLCDLAPSPDTRNEKRIKFTDRVLGWMAIMSGKGGGGAEWFRGQMHGAEVGACGNPIRIPRGIGRMTYIELDLANGQNQELEITARVLEVSSGTSVTNIAQVNRNFVTDIDSTPDNDISSRLLPGNGI